MPPLGCKHCFWPIACLLTGIAAFGGNSEGALAAFTLDFLGPKRQSEYGKIRMFASIGWGCSAAIIGFVTDHVGFVYNLYAYLILGVGQQLIQIACLPARTKSELQQVGGSGSDGGSGGAAPARFADLGRSLFRMRMLIFLIEFLLLSFGVGVVEQLIFAYIQHELHGKAWLCGLGVTCMSSLNIPLFFLSDVLLRRVGRFLMFSTALTAYCIRTYLYTRLTPSTVNWFLACELLHGVTFSLMRVSVVDFVKSALPPAWLTTGQLCVVTLGPQAPAAGWVHYWAAVHADVWR